MLVLSRKLNEKIVIRVEGHPDPIELTVVRIDKKDVRIGITADPTVTILRSELVETG